MVIRLFMNYQKCRGVDRNFPTISYGVSLHYFSLFLKLLMTKIAFSKSHFSKYNPLSS